MIRALNDIWVNVLNVEVHGPSRFAAFYGN